MHFISETALIAFAVRSFGFSSAMLPSSRCSASDLKARQAEGGREGSQAESSMNNTRSGVSASHSVFPKEPLNVHCKCPCLNCDMRETPDI